MKQLFLSFLSVFSLLFFIACEKSSTVEVLAFSKYDYGIMNELEFSGKSVGEVHNLVLNDLLQATRVSALNSEEEVFQAFRVFFNDEYNFDITSLEIPKTYSSYGNPSELVEVFISIDASKEREFKYLLGVYEALVSYSANDGEYINGLRSLVESFEEEIENDSQELDKIRVLNSLDVLKHSIQFWAVDYPTNQNIVQSRASCTLKVAACDALGTIFTPNVAILASAYAFINTCN